MKAINLTEEQWMRVLQALSFYFRNETFSHRASIEDVAQVRDVFNRGAARSPRLSVCCANSN